MKVGDKFHGGKVEAVSVDGRLAAVYSQFDLGQKGRIVFDDKVVGYCDDYPQLMSEFFKQNARREK